MVFVKINPYLATKKHLQVHPVHQNTKNDLPIVKLHFKEPKKAIQMTRKLEGGSLHNVKYDDLHDITDIHGGSLFNMFKKVAKKVVSNPVVQNTVKDLAKTGLNTAAVQN